MKTKILKHRVPQRILIGMLLVLFCFTSKAQTWENVHFNVDWQMNVPLNSNFADKFSGWGVYLRWHCCFHKVMLYLPEQIYLHPLHSLSDICFLSCRF
jgi:hypothetical protein